MPDPRKYTEAQKKSAKKWDAANLDRISVAAPKGTKERWKAAAVSQDKSLNQLIVEAVDHQIAQNHGKSSSAPTGAIPGGGIVSFLPSEDSETAQRPAEGEQEKEA